MNAYDGALLCSRGNTDRECGGDIRRPFTPTTEPSYKYQMDSISASWPVHLAAYTSFLTYQVEWVMGTTGYIRWMLEGQPLFEIPAASLTEPPQSPTKPNPVKMIPEEPMYLVMNVAVSKEWSATPPNPGRACADHSPSANESVTTRNDHICREFPLSMKVDYIRVYQDVSSGSNMSVGCDPATHPTREWIQGHLEEYQGDKNWHIPVAGGAPCSTDLDCSVSKDEKSGQCSNGRCVCSSSKWQGPRCLAVSTASDKQEGPEGRGLEVQLGFVALALVLFVVIVIVVGKKYSSCLFFRRQQAVNYSEMQNNHNVAVDADPNVAALIHPPFARSRPQPLEAQQEEDGATPGSSSNFVRAHLAPLQKQPAQPSRSLSLRTTNL
ncbi:hypothetical protein PINS_up008321 [Pythium insidiosum]|nr:hypothetical protein PINS_up008321 [Pythium insidiosum]